MSDKTNIEWTDATWSPVSGCTRISDGCRRCYIDRTPPFRMAGRKFDGTEIGATTGVVLHPERLQQPLAWRKPRRVFVCSLADLFHDDVPDEYIARVWATMAAAPQHTFQVLTKRPARMRALLRSREFVLLVDKHRLIVGEGFDWPLPNVWIGTSTEDQAAADRRIPILLDTPAAARWISAEPLLGPINLGMPVDHRSHDREPDGTGGHWCVDCTITRDHDLVPWTYPSGPRIDWVVCGGESGTGARPMHPGWARSLRDQCRRAGVPFLFKQWGEWGPAEWKPERRPDEGASEWKTRANNTAATHAFTGGAYMDAGRVVYSFMQLDHKPWSAERGPTTPGGAAGMRRWGKKAAGRELDGVIHDAYPQAVTR